ncbi:MAG: hypothetical protein MUE42_10835 [Opitutaceae bacterium]|nr:hypothetical protein [Opitutaceae bacterium]
MVFQESLSADFEVLRGELGLGPDVVLPNGDLEAHRSLSHLDRTLEPRAQLNLAAWYAEDAEFVALCRELEKRLREERRSPDRAAGSSQEERLR